MPSIRSSRRVGHALIVSVTLLATLVAGAELVLRGVYAWALRSTASAPLLYERVYWAVPPWVQNTSIMYDDPELGLWMRAGASRTYVNLFGPIGDLADVGRMFQSLVPDVPGWVGARPVWHLRTNSMGFRGTELPTQPAHDSYRIAVLGDSWTVGVNVDEQETYIARLAAALSPAVTPRPLEALNFGVIGARAETGARILSRVLAFEPNLVILAYAQNDEADVRNARPPRAQAAGGAARPGSTAALLDGSELYRLWRWWQSSGEDRVEAMLRRELTKEVAVPENRPGRACPNPDVEATAYFASMDALLVRLREAGTPVVLLYASVPEFVSHCTRRALSVLSRKHGVPLVDASEALEHEAARIQAERDRAHGLEVAPGRRCAVRGATCVLLRVDMAGAPSGHAPFVMGNQPQLASFTPNKVELYDDGSHGDQRAGDGVHSRMIALAAPGVVTYAFTNGEAAGSWTGLENYRLRAFEIRAGDTGRLVAPPLAEFGRHDLRSDPSHPDAAGHQAIADALASVVSGIPSFASYAQAGQGAAEAAPP
jgi:lysophospholipase L1-like esterase